MFSLISALMIQSGDNFTQLNCHDPIFMFQVIAVEILIRMLQAHECFVEWAPGPWWWWMSRSSIGIQHEKPVNLLLKMLHVVVCTLPFLHWHQQKVYLFNMLY